MIYELPKIPGIGEEQQGPDCETVYASGYTAGYTSGYSDGYDSVECEDASYFAIEVVSGGTIAWDNNQSSYDEDNSTCYLKYRINGGEWGTLVNNIKHEPEGVVSAFTVSAGDVVEFGTNYVNWDMTRSTDIHYHFVFSQGMKCKLEGNIMSLIYPEGEFETATEFPYDEYGYEKTNWFEGLFSREEGMGDAIIDAGNLLLPATALTERCYFKIFQRCTSLVTPPALPAITLANRCYERMFFGCTSLTTAPELPATNYAAGYAGAYANMFSNCSSLNYVKCMLLNGLEGYDPIYLGENWISGSNAGTFVKHPNATWRLYSTGGVPIGWTVVDAS